MKLTGKAFIQGHLVQAAVSAENGIITAVEELSGRHGGDYILPGLVDVHTHGGFGADFTESSVEEICAALEQFARAGVTSVMATTSTAKKEELLAAAGRIADAAQESGRSGRCARILGINMEGPFFGEKKRGAQPAELLCGPDAEFTESFIEASRNLVRMICFDPLLEGSEEFCRRFSGKYVMSVAHTACTRAQAQQALGWGARWLTHAFNGMEPMYSREPGPLSAALDGMCGIELIGDGCHVHPFWLRTLFELAPSRIALISDSTEALGMPDGNYILGGRPVIKKDGLMYTPEGALAGSAHTLSENLKCLVDSGVPPVLAVASATENPARMLSLPAGELRAGARADILLCSRDMTVKQVLLSGRELL